MEKLIWQFLTGGFLLSVIALLVWFMKRFVSTNDERHDSTEKKIKAQTEKMDAHVDTMRSTANRMEQGANAMHSKSLEFQQTVNNNLLKFKDQMMDITTEINKIETKADHINGSFDKLEKQAEIMVNTVAAHQKSLSLGAQAIHETRQRLTSIEDDMKSIKVKIGKDSIMIKTKKSEDE